MYYLRILLPRDPAIYWATLEPSMIMNGDTLTIKADARLAATFETDRVEMIRAAIFKVFNPVSCEAIPCDTNKILTPHMRKVIGL